MAILQKVESDYTEARLKLASERQTQLNNEREAEILQLKERSEILKQITKDVGIEEVKAIRESSTQSIQATIARYTAQTQTIVAQTEVRKQELQKQKEEQVITEEEFNTQITLLNEATAIKLQTATEKRDAAIIASTAQANEQLITLAKERQEALNQVKVEGVTDITSNFVQQLEQLDQLREQDIISVSDYADRREEIEKQLGIALALAAGETATSLKGAFTEVYREQIQEALDFRTERLEALRGAYSQDATLASLAFSEQLQLLKARREQGVISESEYRTELEDIQKIGRAHV